MFLFMSPFYIQGDSLPMDSTAGVSFLGLCDQKDSYIQCTVL
jgi:hypothetical protein